MDDLVAGKTEERRAQDPLARLVDQDLHEPKRFALFKSATNSFHLNCPNHGGAPRFANLCLGHTDAAERWIGIERVGGNAVRHPPPLVIEDVGRDDLKVVVGGMGKGAPAVAVS